MTTQSLLRSLRATAASPSSSSSHPLAQMALLSPSTSSRVLMGARHSSSRHIGRQLAPPMSAPGMSAPGMRHMHSASQLRTSSWRPRQASHIAILGPVAPRARGISLWPFSSQKEQGVPQQQAQAAGEAAKNIPADAKESATAATDSVAAEASATPPPPGAGDGAANSVAETVNSAADPTSVASAVETVSAAAPTIADISANHMFPISALQKLLASATEVTGLPWWATLALVTVSIRLLVFPLTIRAMGNSIRLANINPELRVIMKDMENAKASNDYQTMSDAANAYKKLVKENDCNPLRSFVLPAVQAPLFITFFFAIRGLANGGLPSLKDGGLGWFTDLTLADPYYVLPVTATALTLLVIESGAETGASTAPQAGTARNVIRGLTVIFLPMVASFPAAVFCYWVTNNAFSLSQVLLLRTAWARERFNLPERIRHADKSSSSSSSSSSSVRRDGKSASGGQGFWRAVQSGMDMVNKAGPPRSSPAVLRPKSVEKKLAAIGATGEGRRQVEPGREGALRELLESGGGEGTPSSSPSSASLASAGLTPSGSISGDAQVKRAWQQATEATSEEQRRQSRAERELEERQRRVAASRKRRAGRQRY